MPRHGQQFFHFLKGNHGRNSHVKHSPCYIAVPKKKEKKRRKKSESDRKQHRRGGEEETRGGAEKNRQGK